MPIKWLTIDQIANHLQFSKEKIYKLCQSGKIPVSKVVGQWRFDQDEVDSWIKKQKPKNVKKS